MNEPQDYSFVYVPPRADALDFDAREHVPVPLVEPAPESEVGPKPAPEPVTPAATPVVPPEEEAKATHPTKAPTPKLPQKKTTTTRTTRAARNPETPAPADADVLDDTMF